jgi:hypothetical protein
MRHHPGHPLLVHSNPAMTSRERSFATGDVVPETGIYRVVHTSHRLPHEVVILKDDHFPRCAKCKDAVLFSLLHAAPDLFLGWRYHIYELPVIEEDATASSL